MKNPLPGTKQAAARQKAIRLRTAVPGPQSLKLFKDRERYVSTGLSIPSNRIFVERAEGALLHDVDGNTFIDFAGGIGCLNSGHSARRIVEAVSKQAQKLQHTCFMAVMYEPYVALAKKLSEITPGNHRKKTALFNSGAEAVENAIKIARKYTGRPAVIAFEHAFHGRTLLALSLTSKVSPYKEGFGPFAPEIYKFPLPYTYRRPEHLSEEEYVRHAIDELHLFFKSTVSPKNVAAIILEPVLGEGGFIIPPKPFVQELAKICAEEKIVFIADEIQSGFARTGRMFASEHFGVAPDLVTMAKSLSNGFPLSAVTGRAEIMDAVQPGGIGGTFGGNPVCCAAALAAVETIEQENLCERAMKIGEIIMERFQSLQARSPIIGEVRGLGAMCAMEIVRDKKGKEPDKEKTEEIIHRAALKGLILLSAGVLGNIIRILVPLVITENQLQEGLDVLEAATLEMS
ncbi:MAG: 4-aminobutyrate--2-oxoglutarate transaminase [Candidatus Omnitrophica bacterium]|nr:4-aminobutyrate--2-oxoglutarate transaminase [Candidatus Omnitrophota bacterium]